MSNVQKLLNAAPDVQWHSFQFGWAHPPPTQLTDVSCKDVAEMGRRLQHMDLLISVDTMAAHLAGALGLPVWTLLPHECDWRWMMQRTDSPWYSTMRLFRQHRAGEWGHVVVEVGKALRALKVKG
jgi:ADP-heptose:LPS heptosyltransferase